MTYRNELDALRARKDALDAEVAENTRKRDELGRMVDEATARARLPVLANIEIATPCKANWNEMTGDERARFCGLCSRHVFNLSELTRDEAEALIVEKAGQLCARYYKRADGTILLADCTIGKADARKRRRTIFASTALLAAGAGLASLAAMIGDRPEETSIEMVVESEPTMPVVTVTMPDTTLAPPIEVMTAGVMVRSTWEVDETRVQKLKLDALKAEKDLMVAKKQADAAHKKVEQAEARVRAGLPAE